MTPKAAQTRLRRLLGKTLGWRIDEGAPTAEQRAALHDKLARLQAERAQAKTELDNRRAELLKDPEFLRRQQAYNDAEKACKACAGDAMRYRVTVGTVGKLFFSVKAQADNWADAVRLIERKHNSSPHELEASQL